MSQPTGQRIAERLRGRHLLVTGSTGLLAKVFVEKLLRSVPEIGGIHLLVRSRADGTDSRERLRSEVLGSSVFGRLRASLGPRFEALCEEKIRVVAGDLTRERLGLTESEHADLAERIDIIVNSAAAVTFDERLDVALELNTRGPSRLLALSHLGGGIPFMQVSTCYVCGLRSGDIPETLSAPDPSRTPDIDEAIRDLEEAVRGIVSGPALDEEQTRARLIAAGMERAQRRGWNDTYTFTKWLGEKLTDRGRGPTPTVILRPAIIEGSLDEPMPGWIDGLRMADPMIMAYGRGKLGEFPADPSVGIDIIPVDLVANAMVAALPLPGDPPGLRVYHVGSSARNPMRVGELISYLEQAFEECPLIDETGRAIRPGRFKLVRREDFFSRWEQELERAVQHRRRLDSGLGKDATVLKRREAGMNVARLEQLLYFARIYSPYTHLDCRFVDDQLQQLAAALDPADRREFPFDVKAIDWPDYMVRRHIPGLRKFVMGGSDIGSIVRGATLKSGDDAPDDAKIKAGRKAARTLFQAFENAATLCGDKPALQMNRAGSWVRYTYREALAATSGVARRLSEMGLGPRDRVVIYGENCPEWGLTYLAAIRAGLTVAPLDPQLPASDVLAYAQFVDAKLICAGRTTAHAVRTESEIRNPKSEIHLAEMTEPFVPPPGAWRDAPSPAVAVRGDQIASILFTSGTTVAPKAVPLTHANFLANVHSLLEVHPLGAAENYVSVLPLYHAFEFTAGFLIPMSTGGTVTYVEQLKGPEVIAAMRAAGATVMLVVPRLLKLFHESIQRKVQESGAVARTAFAAMGRMSDWTGGKAGRRLFAKVHEQFGGRLRMFVSGGSALDPELYAAFTRMGFDVCEGYGLTETGPVLTVNPPGRGKSGSVGPVLPGVELEIRGPGAEGIGELWARGGNVMSGYLDNPAATAEVIRDGWFRTGDLCRRDADGYYYVTGRVKDMIVTDAGKNVYPDEVQTRYKDLPYVKEMCVVGLPSATGIGEVVHAVIVPDLERAPDLDPSSVERAIREAAAEIGAAIPSHQRIQSLHFWSAELPKTSTLKAKRGVIRDRLISGSPGDAAPARPAPAPAAEPTGPACDGSDNARFVRQLLSRLTHKPEAAIRADSNLLLDLGVDSLMKLQIITELEGQFDVTCTDETAVKIARVSDLLTLVGDRKPVAGGGRAGESWHKRLHREPGETAVESGNGHHGVGPALVPVRWAVRGAMSAFFHSYVRVQVQGVEHLPKSGAFILAANHSSHLDSASVMTAVGGRRRVWVAGAQDYFFNTRIKSWVFGRLFDTIPFDRQAEGISGLRRCVEILDHGDGVLFFPEGTRSLTGRMQPFKIGVAIMAVDGRASVVPTRIEHAFDLLPKGSRFVRPGVVRVTFGEPIPPAEWTSPNDLDRQYELYRGLAKHIEERVVALEKFSRDSKKSAAPELR